MEERSTANSPSTPMAVHWIARIIGLVSAVPHSVTALVARLSIAMVFWQSGQTKLDGWSVSDTAIYLFENEYRLPVLSPWIAAHLAAFGEHFFPVLLAIGLGSRFAALALLGMTLVIQVFVYPGAWPTHGTWAACLLLIVSRGPGVFALDHLIARR